MQWLKDWFDVILHLNTHLDDLSVQYGPWIYLLLFLIVFSESGIFLTPFLPGDALLFTVGALAGSGTHIGLWVVLIILPLAAIVGYILNYWVGQTFAKHLFTNPNARILNPKHLEQTHAFFRRHGAKAVFLARYLPMLRTFTPLVAGMGSMDYKRFIYYTVFGGIVWVSSVVLLGYFFGGIPYVQKNFSLVILAIIVISMIPPGIEVARAWRAGKHRASSIEH